MRVPAKSFLIFSALAFLAGCQSPPPSVVPVAAAPDIVTVKLTEAADKASAALQRIAQIQQMRAPATPPAQDFADAPPNLKQPITIRWAGPIEPILKTLAERAGLQFRVTGHEPPVPLTVAVDVYDEPLIHVLQNIGLQAGERADVAIDGPRGVVEIRYAAANASRL